MNGSKSPLPSLLTPLLQSLPQEAMDSKSSMWQPDRSIRDFIQRAVCIQQTALCSGIARDHSRAATLSEPRAFAAGPGIAAVVAAVARGSAPEISLPSASTN